MLNEINIYIVIYKKNQKISRFNAILLQKHNEISNLFRLSVSWINVSFLPLDFFQLFFFLASIGTRAFVFAL